MRVGGMGLGVGDYNWALQSWADGADFPGQHTAALVGHGVANDL